MSNSTGNPLLGVHSLVWDEAQKLAGIDPDFHRNDLWNAIENGDYPEFELGVQIIGLKKMNLNWILIF